ncbi:tetratricopeptide repeat protein [Streptomyces griseus]|uniref:tetratricopeptide repeat protein n=1 Tax=Streptomyces griseus TaxID=1911 RepID=UPI00365BE846
MQDNVANSDKSLAKKLRDLHLHAGEPSMRVVASRTAGVVSHSTVHQALSGKRIPRWGALELIIEALGGNPAEYQSLWKEVRVQARGLAKETVPQLAENTGKIRFRLERVESFGHNAEEFLAFEHASRIKESEGASVAADFLEGKIGDMWSSALMQKYLSLLGESQRWEKIAEIKPNLHGIDMRSAAAAHSVAGLFDDFEDFGEAARHEKVALRLDPNNAEYAWYVGSYLDSLDMHDEAHNYYALSHSMNPGGVDAVESFMSSLIRRSEFSRAEAVARNSPPPASNNPAIQILAGTALALQGAFSEAEVLLKSISERSGKRDRALTQVLTALGKEDEALELISSRWEQHRDEFMSGFLYVEMLRNAGNSTAARRVLDEISEGV